MLSIKDKEIDSRGSEIAKALFSAGADRDGNDVKNLLKDSIDWGREKTVKALLEAGVNPDEQINERGETPLFVAAGLSNPKMAQMLINAGANLRARIDNGYNNMGSTPIQRAYARGNYRTAAYLNMADLAQKYSAEKRAQRSDLNQGYVDMSIVD